MAVFGDVNTWGSCSGGSGRQPSSFDELRKEIDVHESRFQVIESTLQEMQDDMRIWRDLVQDGLADLSIQLKAMSQETCVAQQINLEIAMEKDTAVSNRLFEVEKQMQAMQTTIQEDPEVVTRLCKTERHVQALQSTINDMQHQGFQDVQHSRDNVTEQFHLLHETCLRLEKNQSMLLDKSPQQLSRRHHDQTQRLPEYKLPQPESKARQTIQTHGIGWPRNHVQQHSGEATYKSSARMAPGISTWPQMINQTPLGKETDLNQKLGLCTIPAQQCENCRTFTYGRSLAGQPAYAPYVQVSAPVFRDRTLWVAAGV